MISRHIQTQFLKKRLVIISAAISVGLIQLLIFVLYKGRTDFLRNLFSSFEHFITDFIVDRLLIESLSILISIWLLIIAHHNIKFQFPENYAHKIYYYLKCFLIIVLAALLFLPLGIFLRYLWRNTFEINLSVLEIYFNNSWHILIQSLPAYLVINYILIKLNLIHQKHSENIIKEDKSVIEVINENGKVLIPILSIFWIEKKGRVYEVKTSDRLYFIRKTLSELENQLTPLGFIRINRSVIANKNHIHNYSFWEYDKFILRIKDANKTEFIVSRKRMKLIKELLSLKS